MPLGEPCHVIVMCTLLLTLACKDIACTEKLGTLQVSGKIKELKATIDMGVAHRNTILKSIASDFEHWNHVVSFYCLFLHLMGSIS
jgi:hypothetical protein